MFASSQRPAPSRCCPHPSIYAARCTPSCFSLNVCETPEENPASVGKDGPSGKLFRSLERIFQNFDKPRAAAGKFGSRVRNAARNCSPLGRSDIRRGAPRLVEPFPSIELISIRNPRGGPVGPCVHVCSSVAHTFARYHCTPGSLCSFLFLFKSEASQKAE